MAVTKPIPFPKGDGKTLEIEDKGDVTLLSISHPTSRQQLRRRGKEKLVKQIQHIHHALHKYGHVGPWWGPKGIPSEITGEQETLERKDSSQWSGKSGTRSYLIRLLDSHGVR